MSNVQNNPIINLPFLYKYGLLINYTSATSLTISAGICRDSNNIIDMSVGGVDVESDINPPQLLLDFAASGVNGLDSGDIQEAEMYAIYIIGDSTYNKPIACIATIATNTYPNVPSGYDSSRIIGYWATNPSSSNLNPGYYTGISNDLTFINTTYQAVGSFTGAPQRIDLSFFVPPVQNCLVKFYNQILGNAAGINSYISVDPSIGIVYGTTTIGNNISAWSFVDMICPIFPATGYPSFFASANPNSTIGIGIAGFQVSV
jgi:hypothetical protein